MISEELFEELESACKNADLKTLMSLLKGITLDNVKFADVFDNELSPITLALKAYGVSFDNKLAVIKFLLSKGDKPNLREELGRRSEDYQFFIDIVERYLNNPDPQKLDSLVDEHLNAEWDKCTLPIIAAIKKATKITKKKHDGFKFNMCYGKIYIESMNHGSSDEIINQNINSMLDSLEDNDAIKALPSRLRAGLQELVDNNVFASIMSNDTFPIIICNRYSNHLAKQEVIVVAHQDGVTSDARKGWHKKFTSFMKSKNKLPKLADIASTLFFGKDIIEPDPLKAIDIVFDVLYQTKKESEQKDVEVLLWEFGQHDDYHVVIQYRLALFYIEKGAINAAIELLTRIKSYLPAKEELVKLGYKEKTAPLNINQYTKTDLSFKSKNLNATASKIGRVKIKFIEENKQAYLEALHFLNNLMEKGYSKLFNGYQLDVTFIKTPTYLKVENFPKSPVHAFFAKAVIYPTLHEAIKCYVISTLEMFDWYLDLDGENCAGTGTFAACALAIRNIQYLDLLSLLADETDGEHQGLQINMIPIIIKRYGISPTTIPIIFDLVVSYGQNYEIKLPQTLYTQKENLAAILKHSEQYDESSVGYFIEHWFNYDDDGKTLKRLKNLSASANKEIQPMYKKLIKQYQTYLMKQG